jgi:MFS family permease
LPRSPALRPILALGVTQIVGYGTLYYAFGALAQTMTADIGVSLPFAYGVFSLALLAGGLAAPFAGRAIDRHGARRVMAAGSAGAALALAVLSQVQGPVGLIAAVIAVEAVSALVLYDAAFAALAQAAGAGGARRAITLMTLLGGFASTVFWPLTHVLTENLGWRDAYLIFAGLHLVVCLPLHLTLPRHGASTGTTAQAPAFAPLPATRHTEAMIWLGLGFSLAGAVLSAIAAQWVPVLQAYGLNTAAAVTAGAMMGPAQVGVRLVDLFFGVRRHPLTMAILSAGLLAGALVMLLILPVGLPGAMVFAVLYGLSGGLSSIVRGTVPLALFGADGYAARLGVLAGLRLTSGALAPFALALALSGLGASVAVAVACGVAMLAVAALVRVPR